jgi:5-dehydro-2-deoxygluconokinase
MAVGLSRLGAQAGMIAALGTDSLSQFLLDFLAAERVDVSHVKRSPGYLPSLAITEVSPPDRFPQVFYRRDPADTQLELEAADLDYLASGRMFITNGTSLCASPSRESTYLALERAHAAGVRVVLDVDYRSMSWRAPQEAGLAVRLALPFVDVLIGNDLELKLVAAADSLETALERLRSMRVPMLVSKLGEQGTRVYQGDSQIYCAPYRVPVLSTIGAGDGFASGFLIGVLRGKPVMECLKYGNAAAAIVVSRLSCSEAMPTMEEVEKLKAEQEKLAVAVTEQ